jgi:hypothetical protein
MFPEGPIFDVLMGGVGLLAIILVSYLLASRRS